MDDSGAIGMLLHNTAFVIIDTIVVIVVGVVTEDSVRDFDITVSYPIQHKEG